MVCTCDDSQQQSSWPWRSAWPEPAGPMARRLPRPAQPGSMAHAPRSASGSPRRTSSSGEARTGRKSRSCSQARLEATEKEIAAARGQARRVRADPLRACAAAERPRGAPSASCSTSSQRMRGRGDRARSRRAAPVPALPRPSRRRSPRCVGRIPDDPETTADLRRRAASRTSSASSTRSTRPTARSAWSPRSVRCPTASRPRSRPSTSAWVRPIS